MDSMIYPVFNLVECRRVIPQIKLPRDYKDRVLVFYEQGRKAKVLGYTSKLQEMFKGGPLEMKARLQWDAKRGLIHISTGGGGLDLSESGWPNFQEHNMGNTNSFVAGAIAMKYISELFKSQP